MNKGKKKRKSSVQPHVVAVRPAFTSPRVASQNRESIVLDDTKAIVKQIVSLEKELKDNQPLLNQLHLLKSNLGKCQSYLSSKEHQIAFIGSVGVGKTTAICSLLGLLDSRGKAVLSTGAGRTTLCEVEIRSGEKTRLEIVPCSPEETTNHLHDFVAFLKVKIEGTASQDGSDNMMSSEVERCIRNMLDFRNVAGQPDDAIKLWEELQDPDEYLKDITRRLRVEDRDQLELNCDSRDEVVWIAEKFKEVNLGKNPRVPLPKRIILELSRELFGQNDLKVSVIDTKGLDGSFEREDIDEQFRNNRSICVVCSAFAAAPEQSIQNLLRHLREIGLIEQISSYTQLLVLERNDEAESVMSQNGQVDSAEEGRRVRDEQIKETLISRLKLNKDEFPKIDFFDAKKHPKDAVQKALLDMILSQRKHYIDQINGISAAVREIKEHREQAQAKAAFKIVASAIHSWAKDGRQRLFEIQRVYSSLIEELTRSEVYASTIRAAVNRGGYWDNFNFYYKLSVAARRKCVTAFGEAVDQIRYVFRNFLGQDDMKAAHPFIGQLMEAIGDQVEELYESTAKVGRENYEKELIMDASFWLQQRAEWGRGTGYKQRIAGGTNSWFENHTSTKTDATIQHHVMKRWQDLINQVESLVERESGFS